MDLQATYIYALQMTPVLFLHVLPYTHNESLQENRLVLAAPDLSAESSAMDFQARDNPKVFTG